MNKKLVTQFLLLTFSIMLVAWGAMFIFGQFGITIGSNYWLYIPHIIGGSSPAIASYIVLKKYNRVSGFKEWIKNVFNLKVHIGFYIFVVLLSAIEFTIKISISGLNDMLPLYMFIPALSIMVTIGGGIEEAGWRYILQPELNKKYGFVLSSIIVTPIWALWHLPLFFIPDVGQYGSNFWLFTLSLLGTTFAVGAISRISKNVFLCLLFHGLGNAGFYVFDVSSTLFAKTISTIVLIIVSITAVFAYEKRGGLNLKNI